MLSGVVCAGRNKDVFEGLLHITGYSDVQEQRSPWAYLLHKSLSEITRKKALSKPAISTAANSQRFCINVLCSGL